MRAFALAALVGIAAATAAVAQPPATLRDSATLCLDPIGTNHPAVCHSQSASRLQSEPDICSCNGPYRQVQAPWCAKGEKPPVESHALEQARLDYAKSHGDSVLGGSYEGKRMCVPLGPSGD